MDFGFEGGKFYYRRFTSFPHGTYDLSQLCADPPAAWSAPGGKPC
jgi:hypothetical protein